MLPADSVDALAATSRHFPVSLRPAFPCVCLLRSPEQYRNNDRVMVTSPRIAEALFRRMAPFLPATTEWPGARGPLSRLVGFNERFRFCRYNRTGGHFNSHEDGAFRRNSQEQSHITLNLYLNDVETAGRTRFLSYEDGGVLHAVAPRAGRCLCFAHSILHDGQEVMGVKKYLMRRWVGSGRR